MTRLELEERTNVFKWYYKNHISIVTTQRRFRRFYNSRTAPKPDTIKHIVKRFEENGTVVNTARPGPCQTMRTPNNNEKVKRKLAGHHIVHQGGFQENFNCPGQQSGGFL
ncbi:hypothetical protein LOD99_1465 [Oopsacas minuta]|uniref:DUF4817 domain-containing protein n=1 Tax=Oopsacas minuta TaxID=111878 RepID=A0AAV7K4F7_9METZ|nr:hypothetical protein LOD99_1465 [Oopsacas minuta]